MQNYLFLLAAAFLPALVRGDACVVGGPAEGVLYSRYCCAEAHGKWFEKYPVQAICVLTAASRPYYEGCVASQNITMDVTCIKCDETIDCGLKPIR